MFVLYISFDIKYYYNENEGASKYGAQFYLFGI